MARTSQDVTEAELAVLQALWDRGRSTIRRLTEAVYEEVGASSYATVQKLLDRLEAKGFVSREKLDGVHVFASAIDRDELIGRRIRAVAETLCGGSMTPILTHLMTTESLSDEDRRTLRRLIERHED